MGQNQSTKLDSISMTGVVYRRLESGKTSSGCGIDFSSVDSGPLNKFFGLYNHLFDSLSGALELLELSLSPSQPMIIVGMHIRADFAPSLPVFMEVPCK